MAKQTWLLLVVDKPSIQNNLEFTEKISNILINHIPFYKDILYLKISLWLRKTLQIKCQVSIWNATQLKLFNEALKEKMIHFENDAYCMFSSAFLSVLNKYAPLKTKILRYNTKTFMKKELKKESMKNLIYPKFILTL